MDCDAKTMACEWFVVDDFGNVYAAYSESDAYMVQHTVGGTIYFEGRKYR